MRFATREATSPRVWLTGYILAALSVLPVLGILPALCIPAARAADSYQVTGIPIDATAESAAVARDRALADGQRRALERLFDRLVDPGDRERVELPNAATISSWVASFEVANERRSAVRYLARLTVIFADQAVRDYLDQAGIAFADTPSPPILVMPLLQQGDQLVLGTSNPWLAAWQTGTPEGLVRFALPGDPANPADAITPAQVAAADDALVEAVIERYAVSDVLVAHLTEGGPGGAATVRAAWLGPIGRGRVLVEALPAGVEDAAARYQQAVRQVATWVEDAWRRDNLVNSGESHELDSVLPLRDLSDWITTRDGLARISAIQQVVLLSFSRQEARIFIRYRGSPEQLAGAIGAQGLRLIRSDDGWQISPATAVRSSGGQR